MRQDYFGYIASACLTLVMSVELPWRYAGAAALLYGVLLLEFGIRRDLFDFRLQAYWVAALGAIGAGFSFLDPQLSRNGWIYGAAAALSLSIAIRAARSLAFLPEMERRAMRIGGASAAAGLTAVLCTRLFPESYWGIAILGVSIAWFELAWAALPSEILLPAVAVNVAGIGGLAWEHAASIQQHPERSVWIGFLGAALVYYYLSARLLRNTSPERVPLRIIAPALGSAFALVTLYMLTPTPFVCVAFGALAMLVTEAGAECEAPYLVWNGRAVSLVAAASLTSLAFQPENVIALNCAVLAAIHLTLLFRLRKHPFAHVHGYLASLIVAGALFHQVSGGMLTLSWSLEGIGLLALGFAARERSLRLSGLTVLLLCVGKVFFYDLRNLETLYRILSFIGLGAILLLVSWIYTRFKDQFRMLL